MSNVVYRCDDHGAHFKKCCARATLVFPPEEEMREDLPFPEMTRETLQDILQRAKETAAIREAQYGADGYRQLGDVMTMLFPKGIFLHDAEDFARFYLMEKIVEKLCRYVRSYPSGGHEDSIHDLGVYSFKMEENDARNRHRG